MDKDEKGKGKKTRQGKKWQKKTKQDKNKIKEYRYYYKTESWYLTIILRFPIAS